MITFWLVSAILLGIALAFVLPTLLARSNQPPSDRQAMKEANIAVYRDQLRELEREQKNGLISSEQYEQDRDELERRLLEDVATADSAAAPEQSTNQGRGAAYAVAFGLPILAIALYLRIGSPDASSIVPTASRSAVQTAPAEGDVSRQRIEANVAALAKRLEQDPNDLQGWMMLARSYSSLERYREASSAYAKATALKTDDADLWADYAFALAMAQGQNLEGQPVELIGKALKLDPENPKALELAGSAAFETKDYRRAIDYWEKLLKKVPPDSEIGQSLSERIKEAKTRSADGNAPQ